MNARASIPSHRFWVLGGRWVDDAAHLPWPRVYGPFGDYGTAQATARSLNDVCGPHERYGVVADVTEGVADAGEMMTTLLRGAASPQHEGSAA
jgi:hypothetical protein